MKNAVITEADYIGKEEVARILGLPVERFNERLIWGRGPFPVGRDRQGNEIWVKKIVEGVAAARRAGHIV